MVSISPLDSPSSAGVEGIPSNYLALRERNPLNLVVISNGSLGSNSTVVNFMVNNVVNTKYKLRVNEKVSIFRDCCWILHLNAQSLSLSFDQLKLLCVDCSYPDIIDLSNTFVTKTSGVIFEIPGYVWEKRPRITVNKCGRLIYILDT